MRTSTENSGGESVHRDIIPILITTVISAMKENVGFQERLAGENGVRAELRRKQGGEQDGDRYVGRCGGEGSGCVTETATR